MIDFVGAGSGAADLITLRGKELLEKADVIIYAGSLVNPQLLEYRKENCKVYDSAVMTLEEVTEVMIKSPEEGKDLVLSLIHICARNLAVVGGGNVAMDAARCAKRMGAENVYIIYRRSAEEIPARAEEIHHAVEEGIDFRYLTNPVAVKGTEDGHVCGIECVKMQLGEPDASGRRRPVEVKDSNFVLDVD